MKNLTATDRVLWPLTDNLGTVRDLAKQDGTIAAHYQYDSYGIVKSGDTSLTRYLFTSRELDTDTGLQYNRARWYDPTVGRWISEDPLGFVAGDGNVSQYVGNWVTFGTDPSGLWVWPWDRNASWNPGDTAKLWFGGLIGGAAGVFQPPQGPPIIPPLPGWFRPGYVDINASLLVVGFGVQIGKGPRNGWFGPVHPYLGLQAGVSASVTVGGPDISPGLNAGVGGFTPIGEIPVGPGGQFGAGPGGWFWEVGAGTTGFGPGMWWVW